MPLLVVTWQVISFQRKPRRSPWRHDLSKTVTVTLASDSGPPRSHAPPTRSGRIVLILHHYTEPTKLVIWLKVINKFMRGALEPPLKFANIRFFELLILDKLG